MTFMLNENIDYQIVSNQVEVQKLNLRRQQSTFLPTLAAFYQHQEKLKNPHSTLHLKDVLGVSLTLPIFTSTQRLMKVKQASLELDKSKLLMQSQMADGLASAIRKSKTGLRNSLQQFYQSKTELAK
jgi:outer membrane protein